MDVFYNKLEADPSTIGMDVVGGRLDLVSATSIKWGFQNSNQIRLVNPDTGRWELVKVATEPTIANTALDMNGTALAVDKIYDVFAEYDSSTSFTLKCSRWASHGAGTSSRVAAYASGTTYAIGDRVTYGGHDWVKQSSAAAGTTPVAGNDWVDNGTSVSGDFSGLYRHDGVLVSDSSDAGKSRRWLGIIYTYNNGGVVNFKDDVNYRYVSNFYNRLSKGITFYNNGASYTFSNTSWGESESGSSDVIRANIITCVQQPSVVILTGITANNTAHGGCWYALNMNSTTSVFAFANTSCAVAGNGYNFTVSGHTTIPTGLNYFTFTEQVSAGQIGTTVTSSSKGNAIAQG